MGPMTFRLLLHKRCTFCIPPTNVIRGGCTGVKQTVNRPEIVCVFKVFNNFKVIMISDFSTFLFLFGIYCSYPTCKYCLESLVSE